MPLLVSNYSVENDYCKKLTYIIIREYFIYLYDILGMLTTSRNHKKQNIPC